MGGVLKGSSLWRSTVINTGRTLSVLTLTTNNWTIHHRPKEQLQTFANRADYMILLIKNALTEHSSALHV